MTLGTPLPKTLDTTLPESKTVLVNEEASQGDESNAFYDGEVRCSLMEFSTVVSYLEKKDENEMKLSSKLKNRLKTVDLIAHF